MRLKLKNDNSFKIVQLTDFHIGSKPYSNEDYLTFDLIEKVFLKLEADLVIFKGDLIWSDGVPDSNVIYRELLERLNQVEIPIAITYGNHHSEEEFVRSDLRSSEAILRNHVPKQNSFIVDDR